MQEERRWDSRGAAPGEELGSELEADSGREWLRAEGRSQGGAMGRAGFSGLNRRNPRLWEQRGCGWDEGGAGRD